MAAAMIGASRMTEPSREIGMGAYHRLTPRLQGMVDGAVEHYCKKHGLTRADVTWKLTVFPKSCPLVSVHERASISLD